MALLLELTRVWSHIAGHADHTSYRLATGGLDFILFTVRVEVARVERDLVVDLSPQSSLYNILIL